MTHHSIKGAADARLLLILGAAFVALALIGMGAVLAEKPSSGTPNPLFTELEQRHNLFETNLVDYLAVAMTPSQEAQEDDGIQIVKEARLKALHQSFSDFQDAFIRASGALSLDQEALLVAQEVATGAKSVESLADWLENKRAEDVYVPLAAAADIRRAMEGVLSYNRFVVAERGGGLFHSSWFGRGVLIGLIGVGFLFALAAFCVCRAMLDGKKRQNTDKELADEALQRQAAALEASADGVMIVDRDGLLEYINPAIQNLFDLKGAEQQAALQQAPLQQSPLQQPPLQQPWYIIFPQARQVEMRRLVQPALDKEGRWRGEVTVQASAATMDADQGHNSAQTAADRIQDRNQVRPQHRVIDLSLSRLPDGGVVGVARDISDRKAAEKETEELRKQFFQAQKMESIGRMAGGIAHDFNNILSAIMGYAEFLEEDLPAQSPEQGFAKKITAAAKQARSLINQILSFSRKNKGDKAPVDIVALAQGAHDIVLSSLSQSSAQNVKALFENDAAAQIMLNANSTEISQVLVNLCVNARDAMDGRGGTLTIRVAAPTLSAEDLDRFGIRGEEGDKQQVKTRIETLSSIHSRVYVGAHHPDRSYVMVEVQDTGTGILPAIMEQVFEPFFTTKDQDKGTGLGLSSVLGIIIGHDAMMRVDSIVGKGTVFSLFFPVSEQAHDTDTAEHSADMPNVNNAADDAKEKTNAVIGDQAPRTIRVMLVDDDETVREASAMMLSRLGYEVTGFASPVAALAALKAQEAASEASYDVLMTDYMMPDMKGGELARLAHDVCPNMPVVVISGFAEESFEENLGDFPFIKAFLKKPLEKDLLAETLKRLFL